MPGVWCGGDSVVSMADEPPLTGREDRERIWHLSSGASPKFSAQVRTRAAFRFGDVAWAVYDGGASAGSGKDEKG